MDQKKGFSSSEWPAEWICMGWGRSCSLLRKSFKVQKPVKQVTACATALGVFELRLNGEKVGADELLPGWTDYRKRVYTHTFDITAQITEGENVVGGMLAPGWFSGYLGCFGDKGFYGRDTWLSVWLKIEYADGSSEEVFTDSSWRVTEGPVVSSDLLMGEVYDARKEIPGWDAPGFSSKDWKPATLFRPEEERLPERVEPHPGLPIRCIAELPAQKITEPTPGRYVFDLTQNMVGVVQLKLDVPAGTELVIRHGEMLNADGTVYTDNLRSAKATDRYIAKGGGEEVWQPRFTFHGFRYVEVEGFPAAPNLDAVTGKVWMSGLQETGTFECSNENVNRLFKNIQWGFRGNYLDVPTDCPQRDERLGWTGDTQIFIRSASYLADIRPFYKKWLVDLDDAQSAEGGYPDVAPFIGRMDYASAGWADAGIICPYVLWQSYGDVSFIRPWWTSMKKYMALICSEENRHNGPDAQSFGDWLHFGEETPGRLIGMAYRAYDAERMVRMAGALGEAADEDFFKAEAEKSRALFRQLFFENGAITTETQTACALAIFMELLSGEDLKKVEACLVEGLEKSNGTLSTGFVGTAYLCPALSKMGRSDLALQLLLNENFPSWLYEVKNGATTIWERWNSWTEEDGFGDIGMNSFNHYAFGSVCEWMFESLGGIKPTAPGFQSIKIEPCFTDRFEFVKVSYDSIQGRVALEWRKTGDGFELELETPVAAEVRLPSGVQKVEKGIHFFKTSKENENEKWNLRP